jgi:dTMP kinase
VVCDRFSDSTMAYQGWGLGADRAMIGALSGMVGLSPDLTLVLDVREDVGSRRLAARGAVADRYERLKGDFHRRVAEGFRAIAEAEPQRCVLIDANSDLDSVARSIADAVRGRFGL